MNPDKGCQEPSATMLQVRDESVVQKETRRAEYDEFVEYVECL